MYLTSRIYVSKYIVGSGAEMKFSIPVLPFDHRSSVYEVIQLQVPQPVDDI